MGKIIYFIITIGAIMFMGLTLNCCNRTDLIVVVEAPTSVYEDYPEGGRPTAKVITILNEGDTVELINTRYAKDCEYLKIRLKDGRTGYVGWDGKYKVVSKSKK